MVLDVLDNILPNQFKGKKNIEALLYAFDKQSEELIDVFYSIKFETALDTAVGKQLDRIGEIVGLTRAEASLLSGSETYFNFLEDERYRAYLKYKAYKNSNNCTYDDLIKELLLIWGVDKVVYEESDDYPASAILTIPLSNDGEVNSIGQIPTLASAGVSVIYKYKGGATINVSMVSDIHVTRIAPCGTFYCGTFPRTEK